MAINTLKTDSQRVANLMDEEVDQFIAAFEDVFQNIEETARTVMGKIIQALDSEELAEKAAWQPDNRVTQEVLRRKRQYDKEFPRLEEKLLALLDEEERTMYHDYKSSLHGARRPPTPDAETEVADQEVSKARIAVESEEVAAAFKSSRDRPLFKWSMTKAVWEQFFKEDGIDFELGRLVGQTEWSKKSYNFSNILKEKPGGEWTIDDPIDKLEKSPSYLFRKLDIMMPYVLSSEKQLEDITNPCDTYYLKIYVPDSLNMPELYADPVFVKQSNPRANLVESVLQQSIEKKDREHIAIETNRDEEGRYFAVTWDGAKAALPDQGYFRGMESAIVEQSKAVMPKFEISQTNEGEIAAMTRTASIYGMLADLADQMGLSGKVIAMYGEQKLARYEIGLKFFAAIQDRERETGVVTTNPEGERLMSKPDGKGGKEIRVFVVGEEAISRLLEGYLEVDVEGRSRSILPPG